MNFYKDNLIVDYNLSEWEKDILKQYQLSGEHLPFPVYDLVQTGYPTHDHGEMIPRYFGHIDGDYMYPPTGMWCKVEDVKQLIKKIKPDYFHHD